MKARMAKKLIVAVIALVMVISGAVYIGTNADEVKAEASAAATLETGAVVLAAANVDATGDVPTAEITTYADYLFAGWFKDTACTQAVSATEKAAGVSAYYAKFVPKDTLSVKVQISKNTITDSANGVEEKRVIRFISSVESLELSQVGFIIDGINNGEPCYTSTVYERIDSSLADELDYEFSPKVVGTKSEYFVTAKLPVATDEPSLAKSYTVTACWETLDGTLVTGATRCISVNDRADNIINFTVAGTLTPGDEGAKASFESGTVTATNVAVEVLESSNGYSNVRITLPENTSVVNMLSATNITITGSDSKTASGIFRNYYTTYANGGADTSWYDVSTGATEFVIATDADMWGLASLVNDNKNGLFANDKVILVRDVTLVKGTAFTTEEAGTAKWEYTTEGDTTEWTGIGTSTTITFKGSFDGDNNTISGVYMNKTTNGAGLFNYVYTSGTIENLTIANSYINAKAQTGALGGNFIGYLNNIYIAPDVVVKGTGNIGGVIGYISNYERTISNCWFAGEVSTIQAANQNIGGIVGTIAGDSGPKELNNCLVTGTVISSHTGEARLGGIIGHLAGAATTKIKDCVSLAKINAQGTSAVGGIIGKLNGTVVENANVYSNSNNIWAVNGTVTATGKQNTLSETQYKGNAMKENSALDFVTTENPEGVWAATADGPELAAFTTKTVLQDVVTRSVTKEWYYNAWTKDAGDTYTVENITDLYGFAALVNEEEDDFASDTVKLDSEATFDINPGWTIKFNGYKDFTGEVPSKSWTPIGYDGKAFAGTFDGQGNTISGIYVNSKVQNTGLFGLTTKDAQIKNFVLDNSYIKSSSYNNGAVVGGFAGTSIQNVKVTDKVLVKGSGVVGGIAGILFSSDQDRSISGCWFAGELMNWNAQNTGGIVGRSYKGNNTIENCLVTGIVRSTYSSTTTGARLGGIVGTNDDDVSVVVKDCLSMASLLRTTYDVHVGDVIGRSSVTYSVENVYVDNAEKIDETDIFTSTEEGEAIDGTTIDKTRFATEDAAEVVPNLFTDPDTSEAKTGWVKVEGSYPVPAYWQ